jgi:hypothetical protein
MAGEVNAMMAVAVNIFHSIPANIHQAHKTIPMVNNKTWYLNLSKK